MRLEHEFTVPADLDAVWSALLDPRRVAPCMPGATLTDAEGDEFRGTVKVKLGPITLLYRGSGRFAEVDAAAHRLVITASGKDTRGNGTASATVTVTLTATGPAATSGAVRTDLAITGRPAQFGRGLIAQVGGRILDAFASCLATSLAAAPAPAEPEAEPTTEPATGAGAEPTTPTEPATGAGAEAEPAAEAGDPGGGSAPARAPAPPADQAEPLDLLALARPEDVRRLVVAAALLALVVFLVVRRARRGRRC